jgi:hypothetical protein
MATVSAYSDRREAGGGGVESFLKEALGLLEPDAGQEYPSRGRPKVLPSLCLWAGLLVCVLSGFYSQLAVWRLIAENGLWSYPRFAISDQAIYKRLARGGTAALERLFAQIAALLSLRLAPYAMAGLNPLASAFYALDETTLDPLARTLPSLRRLRPGDDRPLPGKLAGLFDIRLQQWRRVEYIAAPRQNEKAMARPMVESLESHALILSDLG